MQNFINEHRYVQQDLESVRAGRTSPLAGTVRIFRGADEAVAAVQAPIACKAGCSYCCHYHIYVSALEVLVLAEFVATQLSEAARNKVKQRLEANVKAVANLSVSEHIITNVPCAFLADEGLCTAYRVRPLICRRHHAFDATPCKVTFDDPLSPLQNQLFAGYLVAVDEFKAATELALRQWGMDYWHYEMNSALLEAITNKASVRRWRDGKITFPSVKDRDTDGALGKSL